MRKILLFFILVVYCLSMYSAEGYIFRIQLRDKGKVPYSLNKPEDFLSDRAIKRRLNQHIIMDSTDLPVSDAYIKAIEDLGFVTVAKSKWLKTISVFCPDSSSVDNLKKLSFVDDIKFVWKQDSTSQKKDKRAFKRKKIAEKSQTEYGYAYDQINTVNGVGLHERNYKGRGLEIGIIDAGYANLHEILLLDNIVVRGTKDFVYDSDDMFSGSDHGLKVLSIMAANRPEIYLGTAPEASYWLLRSEDPRSEYPVEEDYWVAAAEYADSIGVDIINTSLGYSIFNPLVESHSMDQLDGKTIYISKAAEIAASKGIFVEVSAGNEGNNMGWNKIIAPADAEHVLAVGAIDKDSIMASFSSHGPSADGRVKPDVVALGRQINAISSNGDVEPIDGTSFSGPVMSGLAACLWQAFPNFTNYQLLDIIRRSAHRFNNPNELFGFGIPDMEKAYRIAANVTDGVVFPDFEIFPTDTVGSFQIRNNKLEEKVYTVRVFSLDGRLQMTSQMTQQLQTFAIPQFMKQIYIVNIGADRVTYSKKIIF